MKKYIWIAVGIVILIGSTMVILNLSAKTMADGCLLDGSCCEDVNNCTCS